MKKRILAMLLCIIAVMTLCVFSVTVSAEETGALDTSPIGTESPIVEVTASDAPVTDTPNSPEKVNNTLFSRIWEFVTAYSGETLSVLGSAVLLILTLALKHSTTKAARETRKTLDSIKTEVGETLGGQDSVVNVVNKMIDGYNGLSEKYGAMKESYELYGATEGERNRVVGAVLATNTAILDILSTVYVNSKNLPQGVKDLVNLKYANCLKTLEDDKRLMAIVAAVRDNLGATTGPSEESAEEPSEASTSITEV